MVWLIVMKNNNPLTILISIVVLVSFVNAQSKDTLIGERKKAIEFYKNADRQGTCAKAFEDNAYSSSASFPEDKADEIYIYNFGELEYYKVEDNKGTLLWSARLAEDNAQGEPLPNNNTFTKFQNQDAKYIQCGELPEYRGQLEVFSTFQQTAYKGIMSFENGIECETIVGEGISDTCDYWYGTVDCNEIKK